MKSRIMLATATAVLSAGMLAGCAGTKSVSGVSATDGAGLVNVACGQCHPLERVSLARKDANGWSMTVSKMRAHGLQLTDQQASTIIAYLAKRDSGQ